MTPRSSHTVLNRIILLSFLFLVYSGTIGFGTVWLRHQIAVVAEENKKVGLRIVEIERNRSEVEAELAATLSPRFLIMRNEELNLRLARPAESQIVRISEDVEIRLATKQNQRLFSTMYNYGVARAH